MVREADDAEKDGEHREAHQLDRLAADGINRCHRDPIPWNRTGAHDDQIPHRRVAEDLVHVAAARVADGCQDDGVVQAETVESNVAGENVSTSSIWILGEQYLQEKPRSRSTKQHLAMLPLAIVACEVRPASLWRGKTDASVLEDSGTVDLIRMALMLTKLVSLHVGTGFVNVARYIECVARCLGDGEAEVEGDTAGDGAETDDYTPHFVNCEPTDTVAVSDGLGSLE